MNIEANQGTPGQIPQDEQLISIRDLLGVLWRRLWVILLAAVLLAGSVVIYDLFQTPVYEARVTILVGQQQTSEDVPSQLGSDVMGLQQLTQTVAGLIATRPVVDATVDRLGLETSEGQVLANLSVEQVGTTQVIEVYYEDPDPRRAQHVVNTVGEVFSDQVSEISPNANSITATVWEEAALPTIPVSPNPVRDGLLALILGGMLGVGLALLLEMLDDSWRSAEEVEQISGYPAFSVIPEFNVSKSKKGRAK
jgi:capsular polysaccharide biosynthesis protein